MGKAGDIATGPGETCDQADFDRSRDHHEYDRHGARLSLHSRNDGRGVGEDGIWRRTDRLCDVRAQYFGVSGAPALIDPDIAALGPPQLSKHLPKRRETDLRIRIALFASHQHGDTRYSVRMLRARRERPRGWQSAERGYKFPSSDVDCHVTLPRGSCNGGDDITPGRAALRDFKPAYDCSGSTTAVTSKLALGLLRLSNPTLPERVGMSGSCHNRS